MRLTKDDRKDPCKEKGTEMGSFRNYSKHVRKKSKHLSDTPGIPIKKVKKKSSTTNKKTDNANVAVGNIFDRKGSWTFFDAVLRSRENPVKVLRLG